MFFRDLGKSITDLLENDFLTSQSLKVKTKSTSGVEWRTEGKILPEKLVLGKISASYKNDDGISFDNIRIDSEGRVLAEASMRTTEYLTLKVSAEDGRYEPGRPLHSFGKLGVEYSIPNVAISADVDVVNGPTFYGSALLKYNRVRFGWQTIWNTHLEDKGDHPELTGLNLGLHYDGKDWEGCVRTTDLMSKLNLSYIHHVTNILDVSGFVSYGLKSNHQEIVLAGKYQLDQSSSIKVKVDSNATISASFQQHLSQYLQANAREGAPDTSRFGIGLYFE
eukprot:gene5079-10165_t